MKNLFLRFLFSVSHLVWKKVCILELADLTRVLSFFQISLAT